ncbi:MAG: hypothetical protein ABSD58_12305 [Verrucomicrobiia bacterium]
MITPNALAPDVSLPPMAAINPEATSAPRPKFDNVQPMESFARLMGDTMGDQDQSPNTSAVSPTKPTKDDKKDKDKSSEMTAVSTVLPTMAMPVPIPPSPMPTTEKTSTAGGKASVTVSVPSPAAQVPNIAVKAKSDANVAAVAASTVPIPSGSKAAPVAASKPLNKEAPETKMPPQTEDKSISVMASKSSPVDMSTDDPAPHHEDHPQPQPSSPAPSPVSMPVPTPAGTGTAKQVAAMKPQEKVEGNARTAEKNLPRGSFLPDNARGAATETSPRGAVVPVAGVTQGSTTSVAPVSALAGVVHDKTEAVETQTGIETVRSPQVNKVLTEVSDSAVSFRRIGAESVDVNLQPDRGTEINLHMTLSNGQVEVAARLERGNFDSLNTHWSDLQQSLAQQGIRVSQLEHSSLNQNPEGNQNRNQSAFTQTMQQELGGQRQPSSGRAPEPPDEPARTGTSAAPQRARSSRATNTVPHGWEMWA